MGFDDAEGGKRWELGWVGTLLPAEDETRVEVRPLGVGGEAWWSLDWRTPSKKGESKPACQPLLLFSLPLPHITLSIHT